MKRFFYPPVQKVSLLFWVTLLFFVYPVHADSSDWIADWIPRDPDTLTSQDRPSLPRAIGEFAMAQLSTKPDSRLQHLLAAYRLEPVAPVIYLSLAALLDEMGSDEELLEYFTIAAKHPEATALILNALVLTESLDEDTLPPVQRKTTALAALAALPPRETITSDLQLQDYNALLKFLLDFYMDEELFAEAESLLDAEKSACDNIASSRLQDILRANLAILYHTGAKEANDDAYWLDLFRLIPTDREKYQDKFEKLLPEVSCFYPGEFAQNFRNLQLLDMLEQRQLFKQLQDQMLAETPENLELLHFLVACSERNFDIYSQALYLDKLSSLLPNNNDIAIESILSHMNAGNYSQALRKLEWLMLSNPNPILRYCYINCCLAISRFEDAEKYIRRLPEGNLKEFAELLLYIHREDFSQAEQLLTRLEKQYQSENNSGNYLNLLTTGALLAQLKEDPVFLEYYFRKFEELKLTEDPQHANNIAYALILCNTHLDRAEELVDFAMEHAPGNNSFQDTRAVLLWRQGKYTEAKDLLDEILKEPASDHHLAILHYHAGWVAESMQDRESAKFHYQQAAKFPSIECPLPKILQALKRLEQPNSSTSK